MVGTLTADKSTSMRGHGQPWRHSSTGFPAVSQPYRSIRFAWIFQIQIVAILALKQLAGSIRMLADKHTIIDSQVRAAT